MTDVEKEREAGRGITVVGLGPGRAGLITREAWRAMKEAPRLFLRTRIHPTVAALDAAGIRYETYDARYETASDFAALYAGIADDLVRRSEEGALVYAVPGSPLVAERTVVLLRSAAARAGMPLAILPGMSFLEVLYARLAIDPIAGLTILDAEDEAALAAPPAHALVITQVYSRAIASLAKLALMEHYPDDYEILYIHNLALPDESIRRIPLYALDRQADADHLTSVFVPARDKR